MQRIRRNLLLWYRKFHRKLPWRQSNDPYAIWVSEVMLQQTRVETVIPYYIRFLNTFPKIDSLAKADERIVLKHWEGLGYYSRARNLHQAAKEVTERYGGTLPRRSAELRKLKGFGPYTSAAVASISYGEPIAVVDGNVRRVISRLFATHEDIEEKAQALLARKSSADFNQAVMELGSRICTPRSPKCEMCPVQRDCRAFKLGTIERYPAKKPKKEIPVINAIAIVPTTPTHAFVRKRPEKGLWGGLWEFPTFELHPREGWMQVRKQFSVTHGFALQRSHFQGRLEHRLSHRKMEVSIRSAAMDDTPKAQGGSWLTRNYLESLPFSRLQRRIAEMAL